MASLIIKPIGHHETALMRGIRVIYDPILKVFMSFPKIMVTIVIASLLLCIVLIQSLGLEFVPRLKSRYKFKA